MPINITSLTTEQLLQLNADVVALIKARRRQESAKKLEAQTYHQW